MKQQDGIHWRMPAAMCACWIIGLGLAIGHHFYYYSLDGTRVGNQSKQEWAQRFGTAFAFLTKTFLTTAVGIACIQSFWWILRLKPIRFSTLDSMFDIRGSIFNFFDFHIWLRGPNVAVLGLISWYATGLRYVPWLIFFFDFSLQADTACYGCHAIHTISYIRCWKLCFTATYPRCSIRIRQVQHPG